VFSQILVLLASLGWGVTVPQLPRNSLFKIQIITFLYSVYPHEVSACVLAARVSHWIGCASFVLLVVRHEELEELEEPEELECRNWWVGAFSSGSS